MESQVSDKTTSTVDLLDTLPDLLKIVIAESSLVVIHPFTQDYCSV